MRQLGKRLDQIANGLDWNLTLQRQHELVRQLAVADLPPAVFKDGTGNDGRHDERLDLHFDAAGLDDRPFTHVASGELGHRAIRRNRPATNVADAPLVREWQFHFPLRLTAAVVEDLDAEVVIERGVEVVQLGIVGDADFPEQHFSVGRRIDAWSFQCEIGRVDGRPLLRRCLTGRQKHDEDETYRGQPLR